MNQDALKISWDAMSLEEQLGNIGSEVHRTILHRNKPERQKDTIARALDLFNLTLEDIRWHTQNRLKEVARAKELYCAAVLGCNEYNTTLEDLDRYFLFFACMVRANR